MWTHYILGAGYFILSNVVQFFNLLCCFMKQGYIRYCFTKQIRPICHALYGNSTKDLCVILTSWKLKQVSPESLQQCSTEATTNFCKCLWRHI